MLFQQIFIAHARQGTSSREPGSWVAASIVSGAANRPNWKTNQQTSSELQLVTEGKRSVLLWTGWSGKASSPRATFELGMVEGASSADSEREPAVQTAWVVQHQGPEQAGVGCVLGASRRPRQGQRGRESQSRGGQGPGQREGVENCWWLLKWGSMCSDFPF